MAVLGGEQLRRPLPEALGGDVVDAALRRRRAAGGRRARSWCDARAEPLVGPLDGGVGAAGDAVGALGERLLGGVELRSRATAAIAGVALLDVGRGTARQPRPARRRTPSGS